MNSPPDGATADAYRQEWRDRSLRRLALRLDPGHISASRCSIGGIYQRHTFEAEKRSALKVWTTHVVALVEGKPDNVVVRGA